MLGIHDFWLFVLAGLALNVTPGPDTLYIVGRSIAQGRRAGAVSVLGISTGCLVHMTAASLGLSVILARSAYAFTFVRWIGAAYLIYLGLRMLMTTRNASSANRNPPPARPWAIYRQAVATNVLNPKVGLFFLAFLPQFVAPDSPHRTVALLLLGIVFVTSGTIWCLTVAWFAAAVSGRLRQRSAPSAWLSRGTGALFIGLGIRMSRG